MTLSMSIYTLWTLNFTELGDKIAMNIIIFSIWGTALTFYLIFTFWHKNWRGPLRESEIADFMARIEANENLNEKQRQIMLEFMHNDKGNEFFMVNFLAFPKGKIAHPKSGTMMSPPALLQDYFKPFIGRLLGKAGYPAFTAQIKGDYIEAWGVEANPNWQAVGLIRYRSRRDMFLASTDAAFGDIHVYKRAALAVTFAVPVESNGGLLISPRIWLAFLLAACAALGHVAYLTFTIMSG